MIGYIETLVTAIIDQFSISKQKHQITITVCFLMFVVGILMCFNGGLYMFDLFDNVSTSWNMMLCALIEVVIVSWIYGVSNFLEDIRKMGIMLPKVMEYYWRLCWCFLTPVSILFLLVMQFVKLEPYRYGDYVYPFRIQVLAWIIPSTSVVIILLFGVFQIRYYRRHRLDFKTLFHPSDKWGAQRFE